MNKVLKPFNASLGQITFSPDISGISSYDIHLQANPGHVNGSVTSKFYEALLKQKMTNASLSKWTTIMNIENVDVDEQRLTVFKRKIINIKENRIKEFNYKVLLNILACNNLLSKFKRNVNMNCELCQEKDDIYHLVVKCVLAWSVWRKVSDRIGMPIEDETIIFGTDNNELNYVLSFIAFMIYKYWLVCFKHGNERSQVGLHSLLKYELPNAAKVYSLLKRETYSDLLYHVGGSFA